MATNKLSTTEMVQIVAKTLVHICGHDQHLDNGILTTFEAELAQALKSIRASIRYREMGCTYIQPKEYNDPPRLAVHGEDKE